MTDRPRATRIEPLITTGEVCTAGAATRILGCGHNTLLREFDRGRIAGYRLPRSHYRRIYVDDLVRYARTRDNGAGALVGLVEERVRAWRQLHASCPVESPEPEVITSTQAARILQVATRTVAKWVDQGVLHAWRVGSHRRLLRADVEALRDEQRRSTVATARDHVTRADAIAIEHGYRGWDHLRDELLAWCDGAVGRRSVLARRAGIHPAALYDWLEAAARPTRGLPERLEQLIAAWRHLRRAEAER